ncbi:MAG: Na(+)-translocating NADH-quinone reductase subunit A [Candidatus Neomarinimicrobiota bacterium]
MNIKIKKGHNICISGIPGGAVQPAARPQEVGLVPADFQGIKPKLVVKQGDRVQLGTALFLDKNFPQVHYPAPAGGTVKEIVYGERRIIRKIVIAVDETEAVLSQEPLAVASASRQQVIDYILRANLWPLIRQRPFNKTADPGVTPRSIFVSGLDTAPLAVDPALALTGREAAFRTGMAVLKKLSGDALHLTIPAGSQAEIFKDLPEVTVHSISGPHPAGNVGIQIHHIEPLKPGAVIWTVSAQQVATLGQLFLTGRFDPAVVIAVAGPAVTEPGFVTTRIGADLTGLVKDRLNPGAARVISGNVLTGRAVDGEDFLGFYHSAVSVLPIDQRRPFLGWARIGSSRDQYTLTNAYLKTGKPDFNFSSKRNGAHRAMVPINAWESVLPMDILPNPLYRSILAQDVEEMEKLGILECDPEDFALATFACPSKTELSAVIRQGLDLMEKEI